jgi:hypothetical protein
MVSKRILAILALIACRAAPQPTLNASALVSPAACADAAAPALVMRSGFWLNLHNFLHKEAKRVARVDNDGAGARGNVDADTVGLRSLTAEEQARWTRALEYYAPMVDPGKMMPTDSLVLRVEAPLALLADDATPTAAVVDAALAARLTDVADIYRAVWWPLHQRHDDAWLATARTLVDRYHGCVYPRFARVFQSTWPDSIRVDASVYATWFGAYATRARGPHVTVSSNAIGNLDSYALETVLHESAHAGGLLDRLDSAITARAAARSVTPLRELSHLVLFYTAGEVVHDILPTHIPYADRFGVWSQNRTALNLRATVASAWQPYLRGEIPFDVAVDRLVAETGTPTASRASRSSPRRTQF